jgi:hypothetical protein
VEGNFREPVIVLSQNIRGGTEERKEKLEHNVAPGRHSQEVPRKYIPGLLPPCRLAPNELIFANEMEGTAIRVNQSQKRLAGLIYLLQITKML